MLLTSSNFVDLTVLHLLIVHVNCPGKFRKPTCFNDIIQFDLLGKYQQVLGGIQN